MLGLSVFQKWFGIQIKLRIILRLIKVKSDHLLSHTDWVLPDYSEINKQIPTETDAGLCSYKKDEMTIF